MNSINLFIMVAEALSMLFIFRSLLQSSSADYYHQITQAVLKLTNFVVNLPAIRNFRYKSFSFAGCFVAFIISLVFWLVIGPVLFKGSVPFATLILLSVLMFIKAFGYLILMLLIVQALCSWLESTRALSYYISTITSFMVAPVQKIIPPIGMIDISLMIVVLVIFFANNLLGSLFGVLWYIL